MMQQEGLEKIARRLYPIPRRPADLTPIQKPATHRLNLAETARLDHGICNQYKLRHYRGHRRHNRLAGHSYALETCQQHIALIENEDLRKQICASIRQLPDPEEGHGEDARHTFPCGEAQFLRLAVVEAVQTRRSGFVLFQLFAQCL